MRIGGLIATLALLAAPVSAADISTFSVDGAGSGSSRTCKAQIVPSDAYGEDKLQLVIASSTNRLPSSMRVGVEGADGYSGLTLLVDNVRTPMGGMSDTTVSIFDRSDLLRALRSKKPIFVTGQKRDGSWSSSRFESLDVEGMVAQLAQRCPFEAEALSPTLLSAARSAEASLYLSAADMLRVRWVLARRANVTSEPDPSSSLTDADRTQLLAYETSKGLPISRYLSRATASALAAESFSPLPENFDYSDVSYHEDWRSYSYTRTDGTHVCGINAKAYVDNDWVWQVPAMIFEADQGLAKDKGTLSNLSMADPNPFDSNSAVWANVDGRRYDLFVDRGYWVKPPRDSEGFIDATVIAAIKRGRDVSISGTNRATGANLTLYYSAKGFTSAWTQMANDCRRPGIWTWVN